jgi:predicted Zn-dependent protease
MVVLAAMREGETSRVMTYRGFILRQTGHVEGGIAAYERAIALDPSNNLARSYYGQLLVQMDEIAMAGDQLANIRAHGGAGTWAERALANAIATGVTYTF